MDNNRVEFQDELRRTLQQELSSVVGGRYFAEIDFLPMFDDNVFKISNISHLTWDQESEEILYVNDQFKRGSLIIREPSFIDSPGGQEWVDRISNLGGAIELPEAGTTYEDVFHWERHKHNGSFSGRLKIGDQKIIDNNVGPIDGVIEATEFMLGEVIDGLSEFSDHTNIPLDFVENATPDEWAILSEIRPTRI